MRSGNRYRRLYSGARSDAAYTPRKSTITVTSDIVASPQPVSITAVRCTSGTGVSATFYDSAFSATGLVIHATGSVSSGYAATFDPPIEAINGVYADLSDPLGSDLVGDGAFTGSVGAWTAQIAGASLSVVGNALRLTAGAGGGRATRTLTVEAGKTYQFSARLVSRVSGAGSGGFRITTSTDGGSAGEVWSQAGLTSATTGTTQFTAAGTSITLALLSGATTEFDYDDVTLQEVLPTAFEIEVQA